MWSNVSSSLIHNYGQQNWDGRRCQFKILQIISFYPRMLLISLDANLKISFKSNLVQMTNYWINLVNLPILTYCLTSSHPHFSTFLFGTRWEGCRQRALFQCPIKLVVSESSVLNCGIILCYSGYNRHTNKDNLWKIKYKCECIGKWVKNYEYLVLTSGEDSGFPGLGDTNSKDGGPNYYLANLTIHDCSQNYLTLQHNWDLKYKLHQLILYEATETLYLYFTVTVLRFIHKIIHLKAAAEIWMAAILSKFSCGIFIYKCKINQGSIVLLTAVNWHEISSGWIITDRNCSNIHVDFSFNLQS